MKLLLNISLIVLGVFIVSRQEKCNQNKPPFQLCQQNLRRSVRRHLVLLGLIHSVGTMVNASNSLIINVNLKSLTVELIEVSFISRFLFFNFSFSEFLPVVGLWVCPSGGRLCWKRINCISNKLYNKTKSAFSKLTYIFVYFTDNLQIVPLELRTILWIGNFGVSWKGDPKIKNKLIRILVRNSLCPLRQFSAFREHSLSNCLNPNLLWPQTGEYKAGHALGHWALVAQMITLNKKVNHKPLF